MVDEVPSWLNRLPPASQQRFSADLLAGKGWSLLAQIGEDYDRDIGLDLIIGDGGSHSLCIPDEDLDQMRFDRVIGFFQCH